MNTVADCQLIDDPLHNFEAIYYLRLLISSVPRWLGNSTIIVPSHLIQEDAMCNGLDRLQTQQDNENLLRPNSQPSISFVCCIEKGQLENDTLLMLKTFRKYAGRLANSPIFVVKGRFGPPLAPGTFRLLRDLNVNYVEAAHYNEAPWFNYSNKPAAVLFAERHATTDLVGWLDSDILVASEPKGLLLDPETNFAARAEYLPPAIHEAVTTYVPYWKSVCKLLGAELDDIPWINLDTPAVNMRAFFNSGVFVWRRKTGFAESYSLAFKKLLRSKLATHLGIPWFADQVILSPIVIKAQIKWCHLGLMDHHMVFPGHLVGSSATPSMTHSSLIHYSKSLKGDSEPLMLSRLREEVPHLYEEVMKHRHSFEIKKPGRPWLLLKLYRKCRLLWFLKTLNKVSAG